MQVYKLKKIEKSIDDFKKISYNKIVGVTMLYTLYTREIKLTFKRYVNIVGHEGVYRCFYKEE